MFSGINGIIKVKYYFLGIFLPTRLIDKFYGLQNWIASQLIKAFAMPITEIFYRSKMR